MSLRSIALRMVGSPSANTASARDVGKMVLFGQKITAGCTKLLHKMLLVMTTLRYKATTISSELHCIHYSKGPWATANCVLGLSGSLLQDRGLCRCVAVRRLSWISLTQLFCLSVISWSCPLLPVHSPSRDKMIAAKCWMSNSIRNNRRHLYGSSGKLQHWFLIALYNCPSEVVCRAIREVLKIAIKYNLSIGI